MEILDDSYQDLEYWDTTRCPDEAVLARLYSGELDSESAELVQEHMDKCSKCRK